MPLYGPTQQPLPDASATHTRVDPHCTNVANAMFIYPYEGHTLCDAAIKRDQYVPVRGS